jgi:hypothetical protein
VQEATLTSQSLKKDEDRPKHNSETAEYGTDGVRGSDRLRDQIEEEKAHDQEDDEPLDPPHVGLLFLPFFSSDYSNVPTMYRRSFSSCACLRCWTAGR